MNAAARVISETRKFDHSLTQILHDDLNWLDVADQVTYKLGVIMHRCRHGKAPQYLVDCHRCCWQAESQVSHTANDSGATTSAIHCWPPSIHCARPHGLELCWMTSPHSRTESFRQRLKTWLFSSY